VPTVPGIPGPYRILITSFDCREPVHVHVERESKACKFWLAPLSLARSHGFTARELRVIRRVIARHRAEILEVWHEHCGR